MSRCCVVCFRDWPGSPCFACDPGAEQPAPDGAFSTPDLLGPALWEWAVSRFTRPNWDALTPDERVLALAVARGWVEESRAFPLAVRLSAKSDQAEADARQEREDRESRLTGQHFGVVGERFSWDRLLCTAVIPLGDRVYSGRTVEAVLAKFVCPDGHHVIWFTSAGVKLSPEPDRKYSLTATVKEHSDYDGVRQTVITRATGEPID